MCVISSLHVWTRGDRLRVLGHSGDRWRLSLLLLLLNLTDATGSASGNKKRKGAAQVSKMLHRLFFLLSVWCSFPRLCLSFVFSQETTWIAEMSPVWEALLHGFKLLLCDREKEEQFAATLSTSYLITGGDKNVRLASNCISWQNVHCLMYIYDIWLNNDCFSASVTITVITDSETKIFHSRTSQLNPLWWFLPIFIEERVSFAVWEQDL